MSQRFEIWKTHLKKVVQHVITRLTYPQDKADKEQFRLKALTTILLLTILILVVAFALPVMADADAWFRQFIVSGLIVIGLSLGLVEIRRLNNRLANLALVATELGEGKYKTRAEIHGEDSVAMVGKAINAMAEQIAATVTQLERSHSELARSQEKLAAQNQELSHAYERQSRFGEFLSQLNSIDIDGITRGAFPYLLAAARAQVGIFLLFDEKTQRLDLLAEHGIDRGALRKLLPDNKFEGLPGEAFTRRKWIVIEDLDEANLPDLNLGFTNAKLQSVFAIPLLFHNKALGVLVIGSIHKSSEATIQLLRNYTRSLAHALNNALTHQAVQQQTIEFEKANERLLNLDASRRNFVANMSHELRTPLNSIIGFSGILLKNRDGILPPPVIDRIEKINRNGKHLLQLINDILDLSKIEAGHMETSKEIVDLGAILREVREMLQPQADAKRIEFALDLPKNEITCESDPIRLKQVVINLANNAIKFTEKGSVTIRLVTPGVICNGPAIEVKDTGIGISADKLETIFEAFRQADNATSRKYGGTGLGLTICRNILALLGGRIHVSSRLGQGSAFTVELPNAATMPAVAHPEGDPPPPESHHATAGQT